MRYLDPGADSTSITTRVVEAVADKREINPGALEPPLYEVINPDALDALFAHTSAPEKVVFQYGDCAVSVFADGDVFVTETVS